MANRSATALSCTLCGHAHPYTELTSLMLVRAGCRLLSLNSIGRRGSCHVHDLLFHTHPLPPPGPTSTIIMGHMFLLLLNQNIAKFCPRPHRRPRPENTSKYLSHILDIGPPTWLILHAKRRSRWSEKQPKHYENLNLENTQKWL